MFLILAGGFVYWSSAASEHRNALLSGYTNLLLIIFAGVIGAFVIIQQRLQTVSNDGDPIYNLSLLTHGWLSIFLSPISGAVFAIILALFFSSGFLEGKIFPKMITPTGPDLITAEAPAPAAGNLSRTNSNADSNTAKTANAAANTETAVQNSSNLNANLAPSQNSDSTGAHAPAANRNTANDGKSEIYGNILPIGLNDFIEKTSPQTGKDFALLLIWCFIAGFAERFVPDTLMRLVNQKKTDAAANP